MDLNKSIEAMTEYFEYVCPPSIRLEYHLGAHIPTLQAAPVQMEQILLNLVVNARDAIREARRSGTIRIITERYELSSEDPQAKLFPGLYALICVQDDGIGMNEATRAQIFEPFFSTKPELGTGVGLSTVYAVVESGRGYIDLQSSQGAGTTFKIYLPAASDDSP